MDNSKNNSEAAAGCRKKIQNGGEIDFSKAGVSQKNKHNFEEFDDTMVFKPDDWVDYGYDDDENKQSINSELPSETETQTSKPPKRKRRRLSKPFNKLLENMDYNILYLNLTKLLQFLESDHKDICFSFVLREYADFFKKILYNTNLLKSKSLDANYRDICDKIIEAASVKKAGFFLTYICENRTGYQNIVLTIKKNYVKPKFNMGTPSSSSSTDIMPFSQSSEVDTLSRSPSPATISTGFKTHCLRTALAFIKNDVTRTKEFPELSSEQAQFMELLLNSVTAFVNFDRSPETKELYRALWEAVRIHSLKYEFRVQCIDTLGGKKNLVFEKILKKKPVETAANFNQPATSTQQIINPQPEASKPETPKLETPKPVTPKPMIPPPVIPKPVIAQPLIPPPVISQPVIPPPVISQPETPKPQTPKPETPKLVTPKPVIPQPETPKPVIPMPVIPQPETPKPVIPMPVIPQPETPKPVIPTPVTPKPETPKPVTPKPTPKQQTPPQKTAPKPIFKKPQAPRLSKRMQKKREKLQNIHLFIQDMQPQLISDTLNSIIEFLSDPQIVSRTFVPNTTGEQEFYRKCLHWCRSGVFSNTCTEFQVLQNRILMLLMQVNCRVVKGWACKVNAATGIKEVTYIKPKHHPPTPHHTQSPPKKQKVNIQTVLKMAATTDNINVSSIVNLCQSLRNKKKNKKAKKEKFYGPNESDSASSESSSLLDKDWSCDSSSETNSERDSSSDRSKVPTPVQTVPNLRNEKRYKNDIKMQLQNLKGRNKGTRKKKGTRRVGTDEAIERAKAEAVDRFRLRNSATAYLNERNRKEQLKEALSVPVHSERAMRMMRGMGWSGGALGARGDGITEPLMPTLDIARGAGLGHNRNTLPLTLPKKPEEPKSWVSETSNTSAQLLLNNLTNHQPSKSNVQLLKPSPSIVELPTPSEPNVEFPKSLALNVDLTKSSDPNVDLTKSTPNVELLSPSAPKVELSKTFGQQLEIPEFRLLFRKEILHNVYKLLNSDETCKTLKYERIVPKTCQMFLQYAMDALKGTESNTGLFLTKENEICRKIHDRYQDVTGFIVQGFLSKDFKEIDLQKVPIDTQEAKQMPNRLPKPKIILEDNVEAFIERFDKRPETSKAYNNMKFRVLFLINMLGFAKSPNEEVEINFNKVLTAKQKAFIEKVVEEVNLRIRFGACNAEIKLSVEIRYHIKDAYLCAMFFRQNRSVLINKYFRFKKVNRPENAVVLKSQTALDIDNCSSNTIIVNKEDNKTSPLNNDQIEDYNSDESSVEEYNINNATATVPELPPGIEGVNLTNYINLYEENKNDNSNETASKTEMTEVNNKNNIGNGNIYFDNNDNQVIDMKKDFENTDILCGRENIAGFECTTEEISDPTLSDDDSGEYAEHVITKGSDISEINDEIMEVIVDEESTEFTPEDESIEVENRGESVGNTSQGESIEITKICEPVEVDNKSVLMEVNKGELKNTNEGDKDEMEVGNKVMDEIDKVESKELTNKVESKEINKVESKEDTKDASMHGIDVGEASNTENSINTSDKTETGESHSEVKTDCDTNENIVLSDDDFDTSVFKTEPKTSKIKKIYNLSIVHTNHPMRKLTHGKVVEIQKQISKAIDQTKQLPLLMCHGFENGRLIYSCHSKKTYVWLKNILSVVSQVKVFNSREVTKMAVTFYCYFNFVVDYLFKMIELYNPELSTKDWIVEKTEEHGNYVTFIIRMDKFSINFIQASGLALFAGVDKVEFNPIWE